MEPQELSAPAAAAPVGVFAEGSVLRHVLTMSATSTVGFMAVLLVDLLTMVYIAMAGDQSATAAAGLVSKVLFFPYALSLGLSVGIGATVGYRFGKGDAEAARKAAAIGVLMITGIGGLIALVALPFRGEIPALFGVTGEAGETAAMMLAIMLPANLFLAFGMGAASVLRAAGKAKASMMASLSGAISIAILDPILILYLDLGPLGAAIAVLLARMVFAGYGFWQLRALDVPARLPSKDYRPALIALFAVAAPAVASNLALPFADWYITRTIWQFGEGPAAAAGIFDRLMPFAFAGVFAMAPAIGPVFAQNYGAARPDRLRETLNAGLLVAGSYGIVIWVMLWLAAPLLVEAFHLSGESAEFFLYLCRYGSLAWLFALILLIVNSLFNNLGRPMLALSFNWAKATLGTIPFVGSFAYFWGAQAAILSLALSGLIFAVLAVVVGIRTIGPLR